MLKADTSVAAGDRGTGTRLGLLRPLLDTRYVASLTAIATYALIVYGGYVRASESGLACPDWPRCHGELIPPLETSILIEYSHRLAGATVGLLVLLTAITAWRGQRESRLVVTGATLALLLLIGQVLLGGLTVEMELPDTIVALHLAIALILLAVLVATAVGAFQGQHPPAAGNPGPAKQASSAAFLPLASVAALATFALTIIGSYVANSGAGLAYPDWPLFDGKLVSAGGRLADLHYAHRLVAVGVGLLILAVTVRTWRRERRPLFLAVTGVALLLYVAQVFVGASNIWFDLATSSRVAHLALASAIWLTLIVGVSWAYVEGRQLQGRETQSAG